MENNTVPDAPCPHLHQNYRDTQVNKCLDCGESLPDAPPPERTLKIMDAGYGVQSVFFSLVMLNDKAFVHVALPEGYMVFAVVPDAQAEIVKNALADVYESQGGQSWLRQANQLKESMPPMKSQKQKRK